MGVNRLLPSVSRPQVLTHGDVASPRQTDECGHRPPPSRERLDEASLPGRAPLLPARFRGKGHPGPDGEGGTARTVKNIVAHGSAVRNHILTDGSAGILSLVSHLELL